MPSHSELTESMKKILKTADLDSLSAKQVRNKLKEEYACDMTEYKKFIDKTLLDLIDIQEETNSKKRKPSSDHDEDLKKKVKVSSKPKVETKRKVDTKAQAVHRASTSSNDSSDGGSTDEEEFIQKNKHTSKPAKLTKRKKSTSNMSNIIQTSDRSCKKSSSLGSKTDVRVSPELAKIIGAEVLPRSEISLRLHQEVLSRKLHELPDRMYIVCDEEFKAVFGQDRLRVSTLTNHCKKHIFKIAKTAGDQKSGKNKATGYMKPYWLSPVLADIMGHNRMPRSSVVKEMWKIIKTRELQDPKNKQFMIVDDELMPIFKQNRVRTFGMMKFISSHLTPDEEVFTYSRGYPPYEPEPEPATNGTTQGS